MIFGRQRNDILLPRSIIILGRWKCSTMFMVFFFIVRYFIFKIRLQNQSNVVTFKWINFLMSIIRIGKLRWVSRICFEKNVRFTFFGSFGKPLVNKHLFYGMSKSLKYQYAITFSPEMKILNSVELYFSKVVILRRWWWFLVKVYIWNFVKKFEFFSFF